MDLKNIFKRQPKDAPEPEAGFSFDPPEAAGAGGGDSEFGFQAEGPSAGGGEFGFEPEVQPAGGDGFGFEPAVPGSEFGGFDYGDAPHKSYEHTSFFGFFRKGLRIALFKGDAVEEVAANEDAFGPALFIYLFPALIMGVLAVLGIHMLAGLADSPDAPMELLALVSLVQKASFGIIIAFLLLSLIGSLVMVGAVHLVARLMRGEGQFLDFYQAMGVGSLVNWLWFVPLVGLWQLAVSVFVTARVHNISTGKAVVAMLGGVFLLMLLLLVVPAAIGSVVGM